jgi:sphinganine-1-phosphate aldolase
MLKDKKIKCEFAALPKEGLSEQQLLSILDQRISADIDPTSGNTFAYVYEHSKQHSQLTSQCFLKYLHYNALNPVIFNSLRVIENEVVKMAISLFHGDEDCVGNVTSCGTESLLLAMKTYRDARGYGDVIKSSAGHPGINKGCHYVGLNTVEVPVDKDGRMSIPYLKKYISRRTVAVVASAPQYPHGVVDNIEEIGAVCQQYGVPLHVDSAIGGFVLPFIEQLGKQKFGAWDFRVPAVSSLNADIHKYGYCPKGASVLVYRNSALRRNQFFSFSTWAGGFYISPTALGSRNGGCLSAAWGSLLSLGETGFVETTRKILETVEQLCSFVKSRMEL